MPFRVIIAAEQQGIVKAVCAIMRLLSMSTVITLTTTAMETLTEHLHEHDTNLLILGFPRSSARSVIHQARRSRPGMRVLWLSESTEPLPEADATLEQPLTALRLVDAMSRALK